MLVQLVCNQFFLFEALNRLKLLNDLIGSLARETCTLEVLHRELVHVCRAEPLAEVVAWPHHGSLAFIHVAGPVRHLYIPSPFDP